MGSAENGVSVYDGQKAPNPAPPVDVYGTFPSNQNVHQNDTQSNFHFKLVYRKGHKRGCLAVFAKHLKNYCQKNQMDS